MAIWFHFTSAHHSLIWRGSHRPLGFILAGITSAPQFYTKAAHGSTSILYHGEPDKPFVVALFSIQSNSIIWTLHFHISRWLCRIEFILKTHKSYQICGTNFPWKSRYIELFFRPFRLYQRDGKMGIKRPARSRLSFCPLWPECWVRVSRKEDSGIRPVPVGRRPGRRTVDIENPLNNPTDGK